MRLTAIVKNVISNRLGLSLETISEMSAEQLDEHIATNVTKKRLKVGTPGSRLVKRRGLIFSTISRSELNNKIDKMLSGSIASR